MPWRVLAFALGAWLLQRQADLPAPVWLAVLAVAGAVLLLLRQRGLALVGAALLGFVWAGSFAHWRLADALPAAWEGRDIEVTGVVAELPQRLGDPGRGVRFVFAPEAASGPVPKRIVLSWYRPFAALPASGDAGAADLLPRAGERWRFVVRLQRPHGNLNPHGFDYEAWLFERGIRATGSVRAGELAQRLAPRAGGFAGWLERQREATRDRMLRAVPERPYAGILVALAVGDQQSIAPELWRLFAATGITHLMSISGLHVTMIGALVGGLTLALWRRHARLPLVWPAHRAAAVAAFAGAFAYALMAGFGVPAQRTLFMLGVVALALVSGRNIAAPTVLGAALLLVLLLDPWAVRAPGFWLSFGAVALLFHVAVATADRRRWLIDWMRAQWAITLGLIPLLLALFQQFSLVSPFANALAIPLVSFAITPLTLVGSLPGFGWVLEVAHALLVLLLGFLRYLAELPGALWQQHAPPPWAVPLALAGAVWLLMPRGFPVRWAGALLFLPLLALPPSRPAQESFVMTVLDVGQGQAVHVQTAAHDLMVDAGPRFGATADAGSRVLVPYLRASGVQRLDKLIVSHEDNDHAGGVDSLLAAVPTARVERRCRAGDGWEWDGVRFRILHPAEADYAWQLPDNDLSCVLKIESAHGSVLLPGDVEGAAERALLARHGTAVRADILVAPHHGGRKTASPEFVAAVGAREVVFSVGYRNRFGHPHPTVQERFDASGARLHRTDAQGAVRIELGPDGTTIKHARAERRRYWHNDVSLAPE